MISSRCHVEGMDEAVYHADPVEGGSLSYSGMKELLKSPAHYRHYVDQPREPKKVFDEGHIIHAMVLGTDTRVVELPFTDYRSKEARQARDDVYATGLIPVKEGELAPLQSIADAVLMDPTARPLFENNGPTEVSMFAQDPETGVWIRGRADKVSESPTGELILVDLKTTPDATPAVFNRSAVAKFHYYLQAHVYGQLHHWITNSPPPEMWFVAVSKTAPHIVSVNTLDWVYDDLGKQAMRTAITRYQQCTKTGVWPGFEGVTELTPPAYLTYELEEEIEV